VGERRSVHNVLVGTNEGKRPIEVHGVDGRIILKRIFKKLYGKMNWIDLAKWG
jgi:hypothetical protein